MNKIYFCTEDYIKEQTSITRNVDVADIFPLIKTAADMWVRNILGTYFYNYLLTQYNSQSLTTDEIALVEIIKPAVAWRATAEAIIDLSYQVKNKGVQTQFGDNSSSPEYKAIMFLHHNKSDKAAFYDNRLSVFLVENKDLYPKFLNKLNIDSTAKTLCNQGGNNFDQNIMFI